MDFLVIVGFGDARRCCTRMRFWSSRWYLATIAVELHWGGGVERTAGFLAVLVVARTIIVLPIDVCQLWFFLHLFHGGRR